MGERSAVTQESSRAGDGGEDTNCLGRLRGEFRLKNFGLSHPSPSLFVSTQWGHYPWIYLAWRVLWALYHLGWILYNWVDDTMNADLPGSWLIYLTNWGYFLLTCDTILLVLIQLYVTCARKEFAQGQMAWYLKMAWVVYTVTSVAAFLITVLYYALLFNGDWALLGTVTHFATSVYVILDLAVTAMPVRLFHVIYTVIFAVIYVTFNVIYWAAGGVNDDGYPYIYKPLDWSDPGDAALVAVLTIVVGVPLMHLILWSFYMLRVCVWGCVGKDARTGVKNDGVELKPL